MTAPVVAGLLLAAGEGARLGRPKALVELGGERLADRGARTLRSGGCAPILVVTGAADVAVPGARTVRNPHWSTGMGSSLRAGLAALAEPGAWADGAGHESGDAHDRPGAPPPDAAGTVDAVVVALADQPLVTPEAVRRLLAAHAAGARIAGASYAGAVRNPVLLGREHWDEVRERAEGDVGARPFLRAHAAELLAVPCDGAGGPDDIDTPDDLARLRALLSAPE